MFESLFSLWAGLDSRLGVGRAILPCVHLCILPLVDLVQTLHCRNSFAEDNPSASE